MILYTVLPAELILEGQEAPRNFIELAWGGAILCLEPISFSRARVVRVFSTNPSDYLDPRLNPGSIITIPLAPTS